MGAHLDLDDVAATSELARQQLEALRAENERLHRAGGNLNLAYTGVVNQNKLLADEVARLESENARLHRELDGHAFELSPVLVQARNDQLNAENERLRAERDELRIEIGEAHSQLAAIQSCEVATRESLAAVMLKYALATGHGDTAADLLIELDWQLAELTTLAQSQPQTTATDERQI